MIEIAFLCGFNSHSHLSKWFQQPIGMTPEAYRTSQIEPFQNKGRSHFLDCPTIQAFPEISSTMSNMSNIRIK
ncbi:AraC family transcriptional regulator [Leptothermofonsia sp. ETS-13]|uniref:AraC family transcriptional regulator n=1 Tax=Leptothermofonsia sp. ETS-13 TaxID=3035696 RepID=UPI003BA29FBD